MLGSIFEILRSRSILMTVDSALRFVVIKPHKTATPRMSFRVFIRGLSFCLSAAQSLRFLAPIAHKGTFGRLFLCSCIGENYDSLVIGRAHRRLQGKHFV